MASSIIKRVLSIAQLDEISFIILDPGRPLFDYFRIAINLLNQAESYRCEGDLAKAYVVYMKLTRMIAEVLPCHPHYETQIQPLKFHFLLIYILGSKSSELIKPAIEAQYQDYIRQFTPITKISSKEVSTVEINVNQTEFKKNIVEAGYDPNWSVSDAIPNVNQLLYNNKPSKNLDYEHEISRIAYPEYDTIKPTKPKQIENNYEIYFDKPVLPPPIPDKIELEQTKPTFVPDLTFNMNSEIKAPDSPLIDYWADDEPSNNNELYNNDAYLRTNQPLRPVHLPSSLSQQFLKLANNNTTNNIETLGLLAGKLIQNQYYITTLLLPNQTGTSDTCSMLNESEVFDTIDVRNLIILGWIHTHPTQTAFMSSVDLHTHAPYQVMVPESIAIVCAPKMNNDIRVFKLTDPPGLDYLLECENKRAFHPHSLSDSQLYKECTDINHGHVKINFNDTQVIDIRS